MRDFAPPRLPAFLLASLTLSLLISPASAFLVMFEKKDKQAPAANERQIQETQATAMLMEARSAQNDGRAGKAQGIYQQIVKLYPFTVAASEAS